MKRNQIGSLLAVLIVFVFSFTSCEDEEEPVLAQKYYVNKVQLASYSTSIIKQDFTTYGVTAMNESVKYDVALYKVTYKTVLDGDTIVASGTVSVPVGIGKKDKFPIISYQHATMVAQREAPSVGYEDLMNKVVNYVASMGYIVATSDYIGFGATSAMSHPFFQKEILNHVVVDFIRAAREFVSIEGVSKANGKIFMLGYSQGASVTLDALSAIENELINADIKVNAAACGGGAYDLLLMQNTMLAQARYEQPYYMAYMLESCKEYGNLDIDYSEIYNERYAKKIPGIVDGIKSGSEINAELSEVVEELFTENYRFNHATDSVFEDLNALLAENSTQAWKNTASIRLYHGMQDVWIKGDQSIQMEKAFKAAGSTNIKYEPLVGDHSLAAPFMVIEALKWFATL